jgi:hypothetical protein
MNIDPIIKNKLINEISYNNKDKPELIKLALIDILTEDEIENLMKKYDKFYIRICDGIELCDKAEEFPHHKYEEFPHHKLNSYKINILSQEGMCEDRLIVSNIMENFCPITGFVKPSGNTITDICKNNKIIGYNIYPYLFLFHLDDIRKIRQT